MMSVLSALESMQMGSGLLGAAGRVERAVERATSDGAL